MLQREKLESLEFISIICFSYNFKCVCVCVYALSMCQCHQFIVVVALHFGFFYMTNYKKVVFMVSQMCSCGLVFVCVVNVSVSPIYFCGGIAFWIILFEETPHRKWTKFIVKIRNNAEHTWIEMKWHTSNNAENIHNAKIIMLTHTHTHTQGNTKTALL